MNSLSLIVLSSIVGLATPALAQKGSLRDLTGTYVVASVQVRQFQGRQCERPTGQPTADECADRAGCEEKIPFALKSDANGLSFHMPWGPRFNIPLNSGDDRAALPFSVRFSQDGRENLRSIVGTTLTIPVGWASAFRAAYAEGDDVIVMYECMNTAAFGFSTGSYLREYRLKRPIAREGEDLKLDPRWN